MKNILFISFAALILSGCQNKEEQDRERAAEQFKQEQIAKANQAAAESSDASMMSRMGIEMKDGKFTVDINKTKDFLGVFQKNIDEKSKAFKKELKEGNLTMMVPAGIEISSDKMSIDLNQSRSFFEGLEKKMESFIKEFDGLTSVLYESNQTNSKK